MILAELIKEYVSGDWGNEEPSEDTPIEVFCIRAADFVSILSVDYTSIPTRYVGNNSFESKQLKVGDIVIEKSGGSPTQSTGRVIIVTEELLKEKPHIVCSNFCEAFRVKEGWNPFYVFSYLQFIYNEGVFFNFEGKTSGLKNLQMEQAFKSINIPEQRCDISILSSIDKKVAINRKANMALESLAKQIYDYWFVQFDFPNKEGKPYKSSGGKMVYNEKLKREIPIGWDVDIIGNLLDKVTSTPRLQTEEYDMYGKYPIIDQTTEVYFAGFTNRDDAVLTQYPAVVFGDHSCAVKYVNFPFVRGADGTQIMLSKNENVSIEYLYFTVKDIKISKGYARHYGFLKDSLITIPSLQQANDYKVIAEQIFKQVSQKRYETQRLVHLRNYLLPLLMNGQVTIKD